MLKKGNYLWTPALAAADATIEQLCRNVHLHEDIYHVVCIPRLMTARWRNKLGKVADLLLTVPFERNVWPESNHEPLLLAIIFPLCHRAP